MTLKYVYIGNIRIPSYGMMIILGIVVCNLIAQHLMKHDSQELKKFCIMEFVLGIGAVFGAKLFFVLSGYIVGEDISLTMDTFKKAGYSFYGGLTGSLVAGYLFCKVFGIMGREVSKQYLFLLPLLHSIWKIGCFMGGCCYGIPYNGMFSVYYGEGINKMAGIALFPVQILESIISLMQMMLLIAIRNDKLQWNPIGTYLTMYGITRFLIEYLRYHEAQGICSDGQIYSIVAVSIGIILKVCNDRRKLNDE